METSIKEEINYEGEPEAAVDKGSAQGAESPGKKAARRKSIEDGVFYEAGDEGKDFRIPLRLTKSGRKRATPFPIKLMKVLSEKENEEVIAWTPSGKAFMILQPKLFVAKILPDEFKSAKYSSFTRKLHRWGFMRHYRGPDAGAFFHKHFQKGRLDLVEKMSCYKPVAPSKPSYNGQGLSGVPEPAPIQTGGGNNVGGESEGLVAGMSGGDSGGQGLALPGAFGGMGAGLDGQPDLNAAIELEVARRLKERISAANAAVMSQQTMMMMPQQQAGFMYPNNPAANIAGGGGFGNMNNLGGAMQGFSQTQQGFGAPQGFGGKNNFDPNNYGMFGGGIMGGASGTNNANQTPQQESPKEN